MTGEDPSARHARVLEDLDRQIDALRARSFPQLRVSCDAQGMSTLLDTRLADLRGLQGRRNILQRHRPVRIEYDVDDQAVGHPAVEWLCAHRCGDSPCADWWDAAGLATGGMYTGPPIPLTAGCVVERDAAGVEEP